MLSKVTKITKERKKKLKSRWEENPDIAWWIDLFIKVSQTPFLLGKGEKGWRASFDWITKNESNAVKVLEGHYDGNEKEKGPDRYAHLYEC